MSEKWSEFEKKASRRGGKASAPTDRRNDATGARGAEALYVSESSKNLPPETERLLRYSNLSGTTSTADGKADDEFKLKFQWIRPHPSPAFLADKQGAASDTNAAAAAKEWARESAQMVEMYCNSQMRKALKRRKKTGKGTGDDDREDDIEAELQRQEMSLELEPPTLRINLAELIEPPLMTTWLPGQDRNISYENGK